MGTLPLAQAPAREVQEFVTEFRNLPENWAFIGFLAVVLAIGWAVFWMYRKEGRRGASSPERWGLACLRCLVLVTLALILLEPVRVRILRKWVDSYTLVLVDRSSSMDLEDAYREGSLRTRAEAVYGTSAERIRRSDLVHTILTADDRALLRNLARNNRVRIYAFAEEPELVGTIRAEAEAGESSRPTDGEGQAFLSAQDIPTRFVMSGASTNMERALQRVVDSLGGAPLAGVIVLSDGAFNDGAGAEEVARLAYERKVAVHTVGIGDPAEPRNVRVADVLAPANALVRDPFVVSARIVAEGLGGEMVPVELRERPADAPGPGRLVDTRRLAIDDGPAPREVAFQRRQDRAGRYTLEVSVPLLENESLAEDNSKQITVNVVDSKSRVLLVGGGPSWDYQFVSTLLIRDDSFDVSCWLQSADRSAVRDGNTIIDHLPSTREELFGYDVVLLMDPEKSELDAQWAQLLDSFVSERGGGLLYTAARRFTPGLMREPALKVLRDLLPVALDPEADLVLNRIGHYQVSGAAIDIPESSFSHPIMRLADDSVSTKLAWRNIGDIYWHYPVLREKPAATVLMRHGDPRMRNNYGGHVLAAVQFVGAGRTAFLAFDGTYRWRVYGPEVFERFWVQMARYLAEGRLLGGTRRAVLMTDNDRFSLGESVTVTARILNERFEPLEQNVVEAVCEVEGRRVGLPLVAKPGRTGEFEGRFVPDRIGDYRISLRVPGEVKPEDETVFREIRVARPSLEILRPQADHQALRMLASQSTGGRYFEMDETAALPELIPDMHEEVPIRSRPTSLWDNGYMFAWLMVLLGLEWGVRKWRHLL